MTFLMTSGHAILSENGNVGMLLKCTGWIEIAKKQKRIEERCKKWTRFKMAVLNSVWPKNKVPIVSKTNTKSKLLFLSKSRAYFMKLCNICPIKSGNFLTEVAQSSCHIYSQNLAKICVQLSSFSSMPTLAHGCQLRTIKLFPRNWFNSAHDSSKKHAIQNRVMNSTQSSTDVGSWFDYICIQMTFSMLNPLK